MNLKHGYYSLNPALNPDSALYGGTPQMKYERLDSILARYSKNPADCTADELKWAQQLLNNDSRPDWATQALKKHKWLR